MSRVLAREEQHDDREARGLTAGADAPVLVGPDEVVVGRLAGPAVHAALAVAGFLSLDRRLERPRLQRPFERPFSPRSRPAASSARRPCGRGTAQASRAPRDRIRLGAWSGRSPSTRSAAARAVRCAPRAARKKRLRRPHPCRRGQRRLPAAPEVQRGYTIVIWRGRHVAEPTDLGEDEAAAYWRDLLRVGAALERVLEPVKLNYETLGNSLPHLHTHVMPRYADDPRPGWPFPYADFDDAGSTTRRSCAQTPRLCEPRCGERAARARRRAHRAPPRRARGGPPRPLPVRLPRGRRLVEGRSDVDLFAVLDRDMDADGLPARLEQFHAGSRMTTRTGSNASRSPTSAGAFCQTFGGDPKGRWQ